MRQWGQEVEMAERQRTEIDARLLEAVRELANRQGRPEGAVIEEAVASYLAQRYPGTDWARIAHDTFGVDIVAIRAEPSKDSERSPLPSLLDRMSRRFDLDEDEAMRIAVQEQHPHREERAARRGAGG